MSAETRWETFTWPGFAPTSAGRASGEDWSSGSSQFPARRDRLFRGIGLADQPHRSRIRVRRVFDPLV